MRGAGMTVGLLHPGEMGSAVGATLVAGGARVLWASAGRGAQTRARATEIGLEDAGSLEALVHASRVIVSVAPPHAALDVARGVAAAGFSGLYVDANAVSPDAAREIGRIVERGGARFVDAGIIALSVADVPEVRYTVIDASLHTPLLQAAAVTARARHPALARAFIRFVNGPQGRPIMKRFGFLLPGEF